MLQFGELLIDNLAFKGQTLSYCLPPLKIKKISIQSKEMFSPLWSHNERRKTL